MVRDPQATRKLVIAMVKADPTVTATAIAEKAGVSRERARALLKELYYRLEWRKFKPSVRARESGRGGTP